MLVGKEQIESLCVCKEMHGNLTLDKREGSGFMKGMWEGEGREKRAAHKRKDVDRVKRKGIIRNRILDLHLERTEELIHAELSQ